MLPLRNSLIFILLLLPVLNSCSDKITVEEDPGIRTADALLEWHGDYAADGCGFFIVINKETYKPENEQEIGIQFKKAGSLNVIVKYAETNTFKHFHCGDSPSEFSIKSIRIIWIKST